MSTDVDLFGNPLEPLAPVPSPTPPPINDMALIEKVVQFASNPGYVLVGTAEKVYHLVGRKEIEVTAAYEAEAVHQLLDAGWLTKGAAHTYTCYGHSGPGFSVLVPRSTKAKACTWRALVPLRQKGSRR